MIIGSVLQQPTDNLDYDIDCTTLFSTGTDTLATVVASVIPAGLSVIAAKADDTTAQVWLTGGVAGTGYTVNITMTSAQGRIKQDELVVAIEEF